MYHLPSATIADGIEPDASTVSRMNAEDTYTFGRDAYINNDFKMTEVWMGETLRLINLGRVEGLDRKVNKSDVLDHLAWAEYSVSSFQQIENQSPS